MNPNQVSHRQEAKHFVPSSAASQDVLAQNETKGQSSQDLNQHSDTECGFCKQQLNSLFHNAHPLFYHSKISNDSLHLIPMISNWYFYVLQQS